MPRGYKCRRVCAVPENRRFVPQRPLGGTVSITIEELEALRLCDFEGLEQDAAAESMNVSRATLQRILYEARRKTADALCSGKVIEIGGGNYVIAEQRCNCPRKCRRCRFAEQREDNGGK